MFFYSTYFENNALFVAIGNYFCWRIFVFSNLQGHEDWSSISFPGNDLLQVYFQARLKSLIWAEISCKVRYLLTYQNWFIWMHENQFSGVVVGDLSHYVNLKYLNLAHNGFIKLHLLRINMALSLESLNLFRNNLIS